MRCKIISTSYEENKKNTAYEMVEATKAEGDAMSVVNLYPDVTYQEVRGFGGAITDSAGYVYSQMSSEQQQKLLNLYYGKEGIGYTLIRTHIDSCDFSVNMYEASINEDMSDFTLENDEKHILPLIRAAIETSDKDMALLLSPWSPPSYMKTNGSRVNGGRLKPEYRGQWAEYICKYVKAYFDMGFHVEWITVQNEPEATQTWDSCRYAAEEEKEFLRDYLYPALQENGLGYIKIIIWDHNKESMVDRASTIIDTTTEDMVSGVGFHWYTGDHFEGVQIVGELYPNKELIFTEGCVEYSRFSKSQLANAQMYAHDMIGNFNAGMNAFIDWNILLDSQGGPNHVGNYCDAPLMYDCEKDKLEVKLSYDYIGHFSRYVKKGAKRIGFSKYCADIEMTAFKNVDGSIVAVMLNRTEKNLPVNIRIASNSIPMEIKSNTIVTACIMK